MLFDLWASLGGTSTRDKGRIKIFFFTADADLVKKHLPERKNSFSGGMCLPDKA